MAGIIEVKDQGKVRIYDADNSNYIDIVVPSTVSSNRTITLPDDSFTVPTSGGVAGISSSADATAMTISNGEDVGIGETPSGHKLSVKDSTSLVIGSSNVANTSPLNVNSASNLGAISFGSNDNAAIFNTSVSNLGLQSYNDMRFYCSTTNDDKIGTKTERMRIDSSGKVGIATANANSNLTVSNNSTETSLELVNQSTTGNHRIVDFVDGAGSLCGNITINTGSNVVAYNTSSDYRLKENVDYTFDATTRLKQLKPARFNFIKDTDTTVDGFLAHEVSSIVPESIFGTHNEVEVWRDGEELPDGVSIGDNKLDDNGNTIPKYQGIDQSKLVPLLVKTIQELEARITTLENA